MNSSVNTVIIGAARARADQIRVEIADLETRRLALEAEVEKIDSAIATFEESEAMTDGEVVTCQCSDTGDESGIEVGRRRYMRMARDVDYAGTDDQTDRIIRVAEATMDGIVNCTHVAEILIADGVSTSRKDYLRGTVQNRLSKRDDFERLAPGTYRYLDWKGSQYE